MQPIELFHHFALLSFVVLVAGLEYILQRWGRKLVHSMSRHAALQRRSYVVFAGCLITSMALFGLFAYGWLIPTLNLGLWFGGVLAVALASTLVVALVPDDGGRGTSIHSPSAGVMGISMMLLLTFLLLTPGIGVMAKYILVVMVSYMLLTWLLYLFVRWARKYFLIFEGIYTFCFFIGILMVTYFR